MPHTDLDPGYLVGKLEGRLSELRGNEIPLEVIGGLLEDARLLYIRQLDPQRPYRGNYLKGREAAGQPCGPVVPWDQVLPPFSIEILERLENVIRIAEEAFNGFNKNERALMREGKARIPTHHEMGREDFYCGHVYSLDQE